jgi:hypothetical protein
MTSMLFDRCPMCDTPDSCDAAARCSLRTAAALDELMASDADLIVNDLPRALVTVRPGPVLHVWRDGIDLAAVPLDVPTALRLAAWLLSATTEAMRR